MSANVVIIGLFIVVGIVSGAPSPLQVTIDCGSDEDLSSYKSASAEMFKRLAEFDADSFCSLIHNIMPKAVEDGRFVFSERKYADQSSYADTPVGAAVAPPSVHLPKLDFPKPKFSRLKPSRINIPKLKPRGKANAPKIGSPMIFHLRRALDEESSAERMERFKKGVHRMLHVVKVMGQLDQYLSERTRIFVDKLSKTLME